VADQSKDKPKFPSLLICEGPEDRFFFHRLIEVRKLPRFHIWPAGGRHADSGGYTKFAQAIAAFQIERPKTYRSLRDIIIAADNDEDPPGRFRNVCTHIERVFGSGTAPTAPLRRTLKMRPRVTALMIPWAEERGHLERLCCDAAKYSDKTVGGHIDTLMGLLHADKWTQSRFGKAWLRTNLAARCERDPFIPLGVIFEENRYADMIPLDHPSFQRIADFLSSFA
jgi:hypothetical protein